MSIFVLTRTTVDFRFFSVFCYAGGRRKPIGGYSICVQRLGVDIRYASKREKQERRVKEHHFVRFYFIFLQICSPQLRRSLFAVTSSPDGQILTSKGIENFGLHKQSVCERECIVQL